MTSRRRVPFIILQWILVTGIIGFAVYKTTRPITPPERDKNNWVQWSHFTAISYAGITTDHDNRYTSPDRLEEHLSALRSAGFRTISTRDIPRFLEGSSPLPDKALLVIFENGRRDSMIRATPLLRKNLFQAVMAVPTAAGNELSRFHMRPGDIQKLSNLPYWEFASAGHRANTLIPVDGTGNEGHFLSRKQWKKGQLETDRKWAKRISGDYDTAASRLHLLSGVAPNAFIYPYSDAGTGNQASKGADALNQRLAKEHHQVAFIDSNEGINDSYRDPHQLSYLRVRGDWTGEELVKHLQLILNSRNGFEHGTAPLLWRANTSVEFKTNQIRLNPNSRCFAIGSDGWRNTEMDVTFSRDPGARFSVYLRYKNSAGYLRAVMSDEGLLVQERLGDRMQNILSFPLPSSPKSNRMTLQLREQRLHITVNGKPIGKSLAISPHNTRGRIGLGSESGTTRIHDCSARPFLGQVIESEQPAKLPKDTWRQCDQLILPWFSAGTEPRISSDQRMQAIRMAGEGIDIVPLIRNISAVENPAVWIAALKKNMHASALGSIIKRLAIEGINPTWAATLREEGYELTIQMQEPPTSLQLDLIQLWQADLILSDPPKTDINRILRRLPPRRITIFSTTRDNLPVGIKLGVATPMAGAQTDEK